MTAPFALPQTWSREEVCATYDISDRKLSRLMRDGKCGYIVARNRKRRFTVDHIAQIETALEVKPVTPPAEDIDLILGLSRTTSSRTQKRRTA